MTIQVTKRDNTKQLFDITKIKQSVAFACEGLDVNPLELESRFDRFIKNGVKTSDIQDNLIQHSVQLATAQSPDWVKVSGRLLAMDMHNTFKVQEKDFYSVVKSAVKKGYYTKDLLDVYSKEEIDQIGTFIDHSRDFDHSYASLVTVKSKYLAPVETNQIMHLVNAMRFAQTEPKDTRLNFIKDVYEMLSKRENSLATPFMSNLRGGGNVASCFIIAIEDSLGSIFDNVKRIAEISKNGGGVGVYMGFIRAKGSDVGKSQNAAGTIVQWVKIINDTAVAVNQGGKRAGAVTVALPLWHNDIQDFLDMQTEHGDQRMKAHDVFPQVIANDLFMQRDKEQKPWVTFCPFEVKQKLGLDVRGKHGKEFEELYLKVEEAHKNGKLKVSKKYENARDLTKLVMRTQFETGLPYVFFTDTANELNPNKGDAGSLGILCGNLCQESFSNIVPDLYGHVCNLCSINLGNISDLDHLSKTARLACRLLNRGIDLTENPNDITANHNKRYRTIGIGVMGLHDYLAKNFTNYSNKALIKDIFECIQYNAALESVELAKEYGSFEAFEHSEWKNGNMVRRFKENASGKFDWDYLQSQIDLYGMANSQLTSPAPTTSTSIYQDASASMLPIYSAFFSETNKSGIMNVAARYLKENPIGYGKTQSKFSAIEIIDVVAEAMKYIDTGLSMELVFDQNKEDFKAKDLYDAIHHAFDKKLKTIYYIRSIKKNETLTNKEPDCVACSG